MELELHKKEHLQVLHQEKEEIAIRMAPMKDRTATDTSQMD